MTPQFPLRARARHIWLLAGLTSLLIVSSLAPGADAIGFPLPPAPKGGKVIPPKTGTWIGTYEEQNGPLIVKQNRVLDLEDLLGRTMDIDHNYTAWKDSFPGWKEEWDVAHGRVPFVSWAKTSTSSVNSGRYDAMIRQRAEDVKEFGHPILLQWFWEMDGNRNKHVAGSPASFIRAWQRIHRIFERAGVDNASWVWCPNAWGFTIGEAQDFYPGDEYVDWICANGYNWAPGRRGDEWRSFEWVFRDFYDWAVERGKPIMIGEFGVQERRPGEKAEWLRDAAKTLKNDMTEIKAIVYFNVKKRHNWTLQTDSARSAFRYLAKEIRPDHDGKN